MNKYYKYWSIEYDYSAEEIKIYISIDDEHWAPVITISEYTNKRS